MESCRILLSTLPGLAVALIATAATAAPLQTTFQVTASIPGTCSAATATELAFGDYLGGQNDQTGVITVTCAADTPYRVGLNDGANYSAPNRRMRHGTADYLNYELYRDAGRSSRWGNDDSSDVHMTSDGTAQDINVYGRMPAGQTGPIGDYADTITVTVTLGY
jgi:spore coat protein U-like protein